MKMTTPEFNGFKLHIYRGYVQNNYILEYDKGLLLIDGASRPDVKGIEDFVVKKLNRKADEIKLIAVTHCHPDHAGAVNILRSRHGIPVAAPHDIDSWYSGFGGAIQHVADTLQSRFMAVKLKAKHRFLYYSRKVKPDYKLHNGSELPVFSDWKALHAPGHTLHNMLLYNEKNRLIYVADTVIDHKGKYLPPVPVLFPCCMKKTLLMIKELQPEYILLAHGQDGLMKYNDAVIDEVIKVVEKGVPRYAKFFYLISKFSGEYKKNRHESCEDIPVQSSHHNS